MKIIFDMDNTLTDETGRSKRPNIDLLLSMLIKNNYKLILWTNSPKYRAGLILKEHDLIKYFDKIIAREDYDPENKGLWKDIKYINGDLLIDDDPDEVKFNKDKGVKAILVKSYRGRKNEISDNEYIEIYKMIKKELNIFYAFFLFIYNIFNN